MTESPDWELLIQKHLDGLTSAAEAAALSVQIVNDSKVRSDYLKAARLHGALGDESLALDLETRSVPAVPERDHGIRYFKWSKQFAAALVAGAFVGLLGVGVVWAMSKPKSRASSVPVTNGSFERMSGPVDVGFPVQFGQWSGNPSEVTEEEDGNRVLRFVETGNVKGNPDGFASNCSVFQLVDLSALRQQLGGEKSDAQISLQLSARFRRDPAPSDAELPKLHGSCRIFLFQGEPGSIGESWPLVVNTASALGKKNIRLQPGEGWKTVTTSCLLDSEATVALIAIAANTRIPSATPIELGGYFVDDVQLTLIKQPNLPVRFVK